MAEQPNGRGKRPRNVCFTIHIREGEGLADLISRTRAALDRSMADGKVLYYVFQPEACPRTGRNHLQGYVEFSNPTGFRAIQTTVLDANHAHLEARKGTSREASDYCKKPETRIGLEYYEAGVLSSPGKRSDLLAICEEVRRGKSIRQIAESDPVTFVRNCRGIARLDELLNPPRDRPAPRVLFLHGPTGVGKSRAIREALKNFGSVHWARDNAKKLWFDGYTDQQLVVFDEFIGESPIQDVLRLLDRTPLRLEIKGGGVCIRASWFVFSSNRSPDELYRELGPATHEAWLRRVSREGTSVNATGMSYPQILQAVTEFLTALLNFIVIE